MNTKTSWGKVADWYNNLLEKDEDSYQRMLILPNLLRLLEVKKGETILDLACGQGFFAGEFAASAKLDFLADQSVDKITLILSLQNIRNVQGVFGEAKRVLRPKGRLFMVLNHPTFRIPKQSSWGYDEARKTQYRRLDGYLSESLEQIQMHPGDNPREKTVSFHRPLQFYFKALNKNGFCVSRLEEWVSHKTSETGPKKAAEDKARHEFPLFLFLEAVKTC